MCMPTLPLAARLRRRTHRDVAEAQDLMLLGTFDAIPQAVLHGGTAIWRCYGGNRFSEDVDFYLPLAARGETSVLSTAFHRKGLAQQKLKETSNAVFATFGSGPLSVRFEASFRNVKDAVVRSYEMVDGTFTAVRTLRPEALLAEKATAYLSRRKVRDLYDVFFLLHIAEADAGVRKTLLGLKKSFQPPVDYGTLKAIVTTGSVPAVSDMREEIERWAG